MLQTKGTPAATGEWECMECGYIEEGTELERPAKCPECNATSEAFEFFSYDEEEWDGDDKERVQRVRARDDRLRPFHARSGQQQRAQKSRPKIAG